MKSKIDSRYVYFKGSRPQQGDILRDFEYKQWLLEKDGKGKIEKLTIPYLVILTQDCDLEQDYYNHSDGEEKQDKFLTSILVCPAYTAESLRSGTHLEELGLVRESYNSDRWSPIKTNQNSRYHHLFPEPALQIPELVLDFKLYYTIPRDIVYQQFKKTYLGTINELFREEVSLRFTNYLSRIGLPFNGPKP